MKLEQKLNYLKDSFRFHLWAGPEHGLQDRLQGDLQVQLVGAGKLHVDGFVPGDNVAGVVDALDPDGVLVHDVRAVRLQISSE